MTIEIASEQDQRILKEFKVLETGSSFISDKAKELSKKYPNKFIAVYNNKLIAVSEDFENIINEILQRKVNLNNVIIEHIPEKDEIVLY